MRSRARYLPLAKSLASTPVSRKSDMLSAVLVHLRQVSKMNPARAVKQIEKGWLTNEIPKDFFFTCIYLQSIARSNRVDKAAINTFLRTSLQQSLLNTTVNSTIGLSPEQPLHVSRSFSFSHYAKRKIAGVIVRVLLLAVIVAFIEDEIKSSLSKMLPINSLIRVAEKSDKTFNDVVGVDEAKAELQEIVMYLKEPERFTKLGGKLPKGVLLTGPPGTGRPVIQP
jgi:ATP-dependent Zn protease